MIMNSTNICSPQILLPSLYSSGRSRQVTCNTLELHVASPAHCPVTPAAWCWFPQTTRLFISNRCNEPSRSLSSQICSGEDLLTVPLRTDLGKRLGRDFHCSSSYSCSRSRVATHRRFANPGVLGKSGEGLVSLQGRHTLSLLVYYLMV